MKKRHYFVHRRLSCIITRKPYWESVLVGATGKLYLLIKLTILLGIRGKAKHGRADISLCSNQHKMQENTDNIKIYPEFRHEL
ncbi:hypothetical protein T12_14191 [Trichinella patagoniensis]|uniref:Uncharacterized protein n=1 Tax=Trichinella patagoniensis TaxID=990121 RepID=A0A0V0Z323_9BILA|nr:hypothetical protein T12_60 [Trichinella patagoniensis]KRY06935.1 hypothetical protein T12_12894 [Trichinella patagoniensis]KRY06937.1 hypothetical protein T12_13239 [Trichinella patagoniensis]KRY06941.1 hypothetical protein T12_9552 [Trichinella patagoniensis]KRY06950.1 hypothetical protein T12_14191 [Trichinella patagoniensis]